MPTSMNSTLSDKTLYYIEKAKKASASPAILNRSIASETGLPFNSPSPTLTPDLTGAMHRIAELEEGASKLATILTSALDRLARMEEQVTRWNSTPPTLLTPTSSPRRPRCTKGAACKFGHDTNSDSEDSLDSRRPTPTTPRRSKRRSLPYRPRPQVKHSSVPYSPSTSSEPCSPVLPSRSVHDISPTGLQEEHVPAAARSVGRKSEDLSAGRGAEDLGAERGAEDEVRMPAAPLRSRTTHMDDLLSDVLGTVNKEAERRRAHRALVQATDTLALKYSSAAMPRVKAGWHPPLRAVIHSADVSAPSVDWAKVFNPRTMPKPDMFPIHGCSPDAAFYQKCVGQYGDCQEEHDGKKHEVERVSAGPWGSGPLVSRSHHQSISRWDQEIYAPFGKTSGLRTNHGIVAMPAEPLFGRIWYGGQWVLHAT